MTHVHSERAVYAVPYLERGIANLRQNLFAMAVIDFDKALYWTPDDPYAHWNKATALLSMGDYEQGFAEHEWGWRLFNWRGFGPVKEEIDRLSALPVWDGVPDKRLLLYHELGFGDAIMVFRYLPMLKRRTASITLVIDQSLARLAQQFDVGVVTAVPDGLNAFDCRLPLFSAMSVFRQTVKNIPSDPYIAANWQRTRGKIGLCWSGRTQQMFTASSFISLLDCESHSIYALQPGPVPDLIVHPLVATDFADTAKLIERMDHIVTVDTAIAHLAGAMGHPSAHLILPFMSDWRWWQTEVWYPTLKTYRQPQAGNDWTEPFSRVREAIKSNAAQSDSGLS